jgi:hypothetical protein
MLKPRQAHAYGAHQANSKGVSSAECSLQEWCELWELYQPMCFSAKLQPGAFTVAKAAEVCKASTRRGPHHPNGNRRNLQPTAEERDAPSKLKSTQTSEPQGSWHLYFTHTHIYIYK